MSALETVNRLVAGVVYDAATQTILASQGVEDVLYTAAGTYVIVLSSEVNSERLFPLAWAADGATNLKVGTFPFVPGDRLNWGLIVEDGAGGARVDVGRVTWRAMRLPNT